MHGIIVSLQLLLVTCPAIHRVGRDFLFALYILIHEFLLFHVILYKLSFP